MDIITYFTGRNLHLCFSLCKHYSFLFRACAILYYCYLVNTLSKHKHLLIQIYTEHFWFASVVIADIYYIDSTLIHESSLEDQNSFVPHDALQCFFPFPPIKIFQLKCSFI